MRFSTTVLLSFSLAFTTVAPADTDSQLSQLGLKTKTVKNSKRAFSSLLETRESCRGTCQTCFGPTYIECPDSNNYCYDPTKGAPSDQCSAGGGGSTPPTPTASTSPGAIGTTDTCFQKGATCQTCFGSGSVNCPSGSYYDCYEPAQHSEAEGCNKAGGGGSGGGGGAPAPTPSPSGSSNSCEASYGAGNIPCGQSSCYNPDQGESCCGDGSKFDLPQSDIIVRQKASSLTLHLS